MTTCIEKALVDAHFEGRISPADETRLRAHLPTCASCTDHYERRALLASLDPTAVSLEERLGRGLGLVTERAEATPPRLTRARLVGLALVAAAAIVLLVLAGRKKPDDGFASRGAPAEGPPYVRVYTSAGGPPTPLEGAGPVRRDAELGFAYESVEGKGQLMIFGVDEHGHVFWYHPAWNDPKDDPGSVPIETGRGLHPLREAIAHELDGRTLEIHALFSSAPRTVKAIEGALGGRKAPLGPLTLPDTTDVVVKVEVAP
ncbi:MAG: zf-HC2 domain-containing protein [Myxococcales bacterium]|nr:zf-HC2 domain-containing protein [Myxococcales bacterium]